MIEKKKPVGVVIHFYPKISVAVIKLSATLKVGDKVLIQKGDEKVEQVVESMQIDRQPIKEGKKGQEIAIKTAAEVREDAEVFLA